MADKRINALTTATNSTSDDFFAIDGTTNGTKKLSAFSPTFGGNATVTGTLTVNGGTASVASANGTTNSMIRSTVGGTATTGNGIFSSYLSSLIEWQFGGVSSDSSFRISSNGLGASDQFKISSSGNVSIPSTQASTTTSSGALVVSGGVGVGGAIVAGGTITSTASTDSGLLQLNLVNSSTGTSASSLFRFNAGTRTATLQAYNDTHATLAGQLRVGTSNGDIVIIPSGVTAATFGASSISFGALNYTNTITGGDLGVGTSIVQFKDGGGTTKINFKGNGDVAISSSSASTSTSSGSLVCSGGVGVAGAIYAGGEIAIPADKGFYLKQGNVQKWTSDGNPTGTSRADIYADSGGALIVRTGGATEALTISSSQVATFASSIKTAAPSGGTAANWKLGTVASVSPTSPNRTIEVDIGGTIYYIHAKTTNN